MKLPFRPEGGGPFLYLGLLALAKLAAAYLGGSFRYLSRFLALLLIVDLLHVFWTLHRMRYSQNFSTTHPSKGQVVDYILRLRLESPLPGTRLRVRFKGIRQDLHLEYGLKTLDFFLGARGFEEHRKQIQCPFRGTYTVGLDSMELQDALGLFWIQVPVWFITFYVYPRLLELSSCRLAEEGRQDARSALASGTVADSTRFRSLIECRPGESVKRLAWKKYAATGLPYLREFDTSAFPGISLYLDTRRRSEVGYQSLLAEDCALEILLSLAHWFIRQDIPVFFRTASSLVRVSREARDFSGFISDSANIHFKDPDDTNAFSVLDELETDIQEGKLETIVVAGIFRSFDQEVVSFLENYNDENRRCYALLVLSALDSGENKKARAYRASLINSERMIFIQDSDTLRTELS